MDNYYSDLTINSLHKALEALVNARQYASDAHAPIWMLKNMKKMSSGIQNRINDIFILRKPKKG